MSISPKPDASWEHFPHEADVGIRGLGPSRETAFEQAATVRPDRTIMVDCHAPDDELLLLEWLNALIYQMATRRMLFSEFHVQARAGGLHAIARGEPVVVSRHEPAVEVKGATLAELRVRCDEGRWLAQCVVDV
jgi:tRNA nucleotidyltransferase (CCA-adding enzyme)